MHKLTNKYKTVDPVFITLSTEEKKILRDQWKQLVQNLVFVSILSDTEVNDKEKITNLRATDTDFNGSQQCVASNFRS